MKDLENLFGGKWGISAKRGGNMNQNNEIEKAKDKYEMWRQAASYDDYMFKKIFVETLRTVRICLDYYATGQSDGGQIARDIQSFIDKKLIE